MAAFQDAPGSNYLAELKALHVHSVHVTAHQLFAIRKNFGDAKGGKNAPESSTDGDWEDQASAGVSQLAPL